MTRPKIENSISWGNIITIAIVLSGIVSAWYGFENRLSLAEAQIRLNTGDIVQLNDERDDTRDRLTRLEVQLTYITSTLERIAEAVGADP